MPSKLPDQLNVSLEYQENTSVQEVTPLAGFVPQIQLTALKDKTVVQSENQFLTSCEIDSTNDVIVIEEKISQLEVRYKKNRQKLEQQKSVLVTKDMFHTDSKRPSYAMDHPLLLCQYCSSPDHRSSM